MGSGRTRELASISAVRELIKGAGIHPSRSLGQNFLADANVLKVIERAAALSPGDTVIEVGAGLGALTQMLIASCGRVFALESDPRLAAILERELGTAENLTIIEADASRFEFERLWEGEPPPAVKMVSNLPYGIAATLLVDCLYSYPWITRYTVTVQREIADRLTAAPGSGDYSAATVKVRYQAAVNKVAGVSRNCFYPRPRVDSTVLRIERLSEHGTPGGPPRAAQDERFFSDLVTAAFGQRRKKLANSISASTVVSVDRERVRDALDSLGRDPGTRAEELSPDDFVELSNMLRAGEQASEQRG